MKIAISYTPNPININDLIYRILRDNKNKIVGVVATEGSKIKKRKLIDKIDYYLGMMLIIGPFAALNSVFKIMKDKTKKDRRIEKFCKANGIKLIKVKTINGETAKNFLKELKPDLIFNQAHHIIKRDVIDIPLIGVLNIHGGTLPKYRGAFTSFWQLYNEEERRGICYHLLDEKLDSGPIVYQEEIPINNSDTVNKLIKQKFDVGVKLFSKVIDLLSRDDWKERLIKNDDENAGYYTFPNFKQALQYRLRRIKYFSKVKF